jgi:glycosyltransferase involved in cell wall biosynthesis
MNHDKGTYDMLKAISDNAAKLRGKFKLNIGGNGETEKVLTFIEQNGISDIVEFYGWVSGDEKVKLLNESDVYILPSYYEGLPISILEAMSYRMPIISTPVGGIPEIVDESNGVLVEPGNTKQISEAINTFLNNKDRLQTMGENSYKKAQPYLPDNVCKQLNELYKSLI